MAIHHPTKSRTSRATAGRIAKSNSAAVSSVGARPAARHLEIMVSPRSAIAYFVAGECSSVTPEAKVHSAPLVLFRGKADEPHYDLKKKLGRCGALLPLFRLV